MVLNPRLKSLWLRENTYQQGNRFRHDTGAFTLVSPRFLPLLHLWLPCEQGSYSFAVWSIHTYPICSTVTWGPGRTKPLLPVPILQWLTCFFGAINQKFITLPRPVPA